MLMNSRPPTMSGVALRLFVYGAWRSRQRSGSAWSRASKMTSDGARHSPPPGVVMLTRASADCQRQAISRSPKLPASIWSRGEYLVLPRSPP